LQVERIVAARLAVGQGSPDIQVVASRIGTSVRTLQRQLRAAGVTYAGVVQQTRCTVARRLLQDQGQKIGEVARLLGYSDPAHFTRAFQRRTGLTPRDYRRRG
jgi:AraC-like DNA-binding protein